MSTAHPAQDPAHHTDGPADGPADGSVRDAVLVTGASGTTGSRVAARLVARGLPVVAATRRATPVPGARAVRFDWTDPSTFAPALDGVGRMYLVPPVGSTDPAAAMLPFLRQARAAGAHRVVLLSASSVPRGGPAVGQVHEELPGLFDDWAVLRPSWFMQNFTGDHLHAHSARTEGVIRTATGDGRVAFVDADDIADVAVHALTDPAAPRTDLVLTGPEALDYADVAATLTALTGSRVVHQRLTRDEQCAHFRDRTGVPGPFAALLADMDVAIAGGAEDRTTDTVHRVTGHPPRRFADCAARELGLPAPTTDRPAAR
ncbi:NAD(P)H-binding protein [Streptomyces cacaoi]|uniref:NAD(P)H-binding protein n=1 Tax=Streptomyces cacaoi TaxID=1898 RepID=UPI00331FC22D